jgi:hypothetical protein
MLGRRAASMARQRLLREGPGSPAANAHAHRPG